MMRALILFAAYSGMRRGELFALRWSASTTKRCGSTRHRAAWWMHVELGMPERLVAVQLGHTDGGKLVRELYGHSDHGALTEIDRYLDAPTNVVPLRLTG